jgi:hypothetical protein
MYGIQCYLLIIKINKYHNIGISLDPINYLLSLLLNNSLSYNAIYK